MNSNKKELVKTLLKQDLRTKDEEEIMEMLLDNTISINVEKTQDNNLTMGDKVADKISAVAGSWGFIVTFCSFLILWMFLNSFVFINKLDPYPFILLNLLLSCLAALQAPIIMMSQNRQAKKDSIRNQNDYMVDLKSELIIEKLHHDLEKVQKTQNKILKILEEKETKKEK